MAERTENNKIFRSKALDGLNVSEGEETEVKVTTPSVYVFIASMAILVVAVFAWCIFGSISDKSNVSGVIFPIDNVIDVTLPNRGTVRSIFVSAGDNVNAGQALAMVSVGDAYSMISSPSAGTVLDIRKENDQFEALAPIATIIDSGQEQIYTVVSFVPFEMSRKLKPGMEVEITPKNLTREKNGYISGHIVEVEKYPISKEDAIKKLKSETFTGDIFPQQGAAFVVKMQLNRNADGSPAWSFEPEDPVELDAGTFCQIQIITKRRSVYKYLFESVREKSHKLQMSFK